MPLEKAEVVSAAVRDGFVRIALIDLLSVNLTHFISGLSVASAVRQQCGTVSSITGYTEWIGVTQEASISLGWDWRLERDVMRGNGVFVRMGLPYSNIMLIDAANRDYGWDRNLELLSTVVDAMPWADQTREAIQQHAEPRIDASLPSRR